MTGSLGRLEKVDLRTAWVSESGSFTPWLAQPENIALLGETLCLELELEAQEREVGPFRADILCKETGNDTWVLIENQLERTDHTHLGQLLTYAAGLEAVTIVWIAQAFTEEHRATLDWLNEITEERFNFFGLEMELWRIGDSAPAPKFNVVSKPNDWTRQVTRGVSALNRELTPNRQTQLDYWTVFRESVRESGSFIKPTKPLPQNWMNIALGRSGFKLAAVASFCDSVADSWASHELRAEVVIETESSKAYFKALLERKAGLEHDVGEPLIWYNPPESRMCRIFFRRGADLNNRNDWPEQHAWLRERLERLHKTFGPVVRQLVVVTNNGGE
jgi:hypothetical protein